MCIIDYPYVYELDERKIFCKAPDPTSPSGCCDGEIDYDDGFNFLKCTRCGVKYRAKELARKIEEKMVTVNERSNLTMNIKVSGGSKNINIEERKEGVIGEVAQQLTGNDMVRAIPNRPTVSVKPGQQEGNTSSIKLNIAAGRRNEVKKYNNRPQHHVNKTVNGATVVKNEEKIKPEVPVMTEPVVVPHTNVPPTAPTPPADVTRPAEPMPVTPVIELKPVAMNDAKVIPVDEKNSAIVGVTFDTKDVTPIDNSSPVFEIEKALNIIIDNIAKVNIKEVKEDIEDRIFDKLINNPNIDNSAIGKLLIKLLSKVAELDEDILSDHDMISDIIEKYYELEAKVNEAGDKIEASIVTNTTNRKEVMCLIEQIKTHEPAATEHEEESKEATDDNSFKGIAWYTGKKMNTNELIPNIDDPCNILTVVDDEGNYLTDKNNFLIAVDCIDNVSLDNYEVVSKAWLEGLIAENESYGGNPFNKEEEEAEVKEAPVGALPVQQNESVQNAISEFVKEEQ